MIRVTKTSLPKLGEYTKYLKEIWKTGFVTNNGIFSIKLEERLAKFLDVRYLRLVSNATLGLQIAYKVLNLSGEVITTPFTFPATSNSLIWEGLKPVYADVDPETFNLDPKEVEKKITKKTCAILPVHVFGNACDVESFDKLSKKYNIKVIYDSAHVFGVKYKGRPLLKWGDVNVLSFHAAKIFHTIEGGAVISKNKDIAKKVELMRNHGIEMGVYDVVSLAGTNAKMNEFQAVMGLCNLKYFPSEVEKRKRIYKLYKELLGKNSKLKFQTIKSSKYNYAYFPVCFPDERTRDKVYKTLLKNEIWPRKYFYPPSNELPYVKSNVKDLENSTRISHTILCMPMYGRLSLKDVRRITSIVNDLV